MNSPIDTLESVDLADAAAFSSSKDTIERDVICGICPAGCWVTATVEDGRFTKVKAQEDHPLGMICKLGRHSPEMVYSQDRLTHPMRRAGPRGSGEFEQITWDEAYEAITANLNRIKAESGPEANAIYTGRGSFELAMCDVFQPADTAVSSASSVLFPFGSPNTFGVGALCYVSYAMIAPHVTMGGMLINMESELNGAELIVVWGTNPATDSPPLTHQQILAAKKRGAEVVVIDPQYTETAREADAQWIPIRPGTDGAFALSMIEVLIDEDLLDEDFAENWTVGFEDLKQYVQHFRPEVVEETTGVPAEVIRDLARRIANARGASPVMYTGLEYSDSGVQAIRATMILWALAGQLDVPGGRVFKMTENTFHINRDGLVSNPNTKKAIGRDRFPVYSMYRGESHAISLPEAVLEGRPYPIKSLIVLGGSIITAWPEPDVWRKTLDSLDFLVTIDRQLTADSAYADIVLPATTGYEIDSYMVYGPIFRLREKLIEPVGEARNDFFIMAELADRLGYGDLYPQNEEELLNYVLTGSGHTLEEVRKAGGMIQKQPQMMQYKKWEKGELRADGKPGFETPSGKFEIASSILEENGYDALPVYTEPGEGPLASPEIAAEFPLVFNSGARVKTDFRSQHHGVEGLAKEAPVPTVTIHPLDARARGVADGDQVNVRTPRGSVEFRARVSKDILAGAIDANMGGGGPVGSVEWQNANVNDLTDLNRYDPISGFPVYKALLCEIDRIGGPRADDDPLLPEFSEEDITSAQSCQTPVLSGASGREAPERSVYLDHNATTPIDSEVVEAMLPYLTEMYGNPSAIHSSGSLAKDAIESSRRIIAQVIGTTARRIIFTGGGSESDNLAIKGVVEALSPRGGGHIITTVFEHPAVLNTCRQLETRGYEVTYLEVDDKGIVKTEDLRTAIRKDTLLVSVMLANNELGTVQPIRELSDIAHEHDVLFHVDAVQALGKITVDVDELGADLMSFSSHKIHGPKGVGALYVRQGTHLEPVLHGAGHERWLRPGTENVSHIVALGQAASIAERNLNEAAERMAMLRDRLEHRLTDAMPKRLTINGQRAERLPNTLSLNFPRANGSELLRRIPELCASTGSACHSGSDNLSPTLAAIGLTPQVAAGTIRLSVGWYTSEDDVDRAANLLLAAWEGVEE